MNNPDGVALSLFCHRLASICEEMGARLKRAAFSPNIKDRLDFSCAIFDARGELCAQAAHIPVHLGSMAFAMADLVSSIEWQEGDVFIVNDPYKGGTHLPDVTVVCPVFYQNSTHAFVANRAHHANIGSDSPGSMPVSSHLEQEGLLIEPSLVKREGQYLPLWASLCELSADGEGGDFVAQVSACESAIDSVRALVAKGDFDTLLQQVNDYGEQLATAAYRKIPDGEYTFSDLMDDDGQGETDIQICLTMTIEQGKVHADFKGTHPQVSGNINCPISVAAAAVYYVFRCLLPDYAPACAGIFRPLTLAAPLGSLVNATFPHAVAAGNVETSSRIVDVTLGALSKALPGQIPAASTGSMNNLAMGCHASDSSRAWSYYETMGGGAGAHAMAGGLSAVQCHMTNTLNTPIESLESHYPLLIKRYEIRRGSGGKGQFTGGDGLVREYQLLSDASVSLLTERRRYPPWGLQGGEAGKPGKNLLNGEAIAGKCEKKLKNGDVLTIKTPGGGGWGRPL